MRLFSQDRGRVILFNFDGLRHKQKRRQVPSSQLLFLSVSKVRHKCPRLGCPFRVKKIWQNFSRLVSEYKAVFCYRGRFILPACTGSLQIRQFLIFFLEMRRSNQKWKEVFNGEFIKDAFLIFALLFFSLLHFYPAYYQYVVWWLRCILNERLFICCACFSLWAFFLTENRVISNHQFPIIRFQHWRIQGYKFDIQYILKKFKKKILESLVNFKC